jgi:hypothetical protein
MAAATRTGKRESRGDRHSKRVQDLTGSRWSWPRCNVQRGIANILHRETIAVIVGSQTFQRGEKVFASGRVDKVEVAGGELKGVVKPTEAGAPYIVRIWMREEGLAYECTCPIGQRRQFCKHTVAIALHHLETERKEAQQGLDVMRQEAPQGPDVLRQALTTIPHETLIDGLLVLARHDPGWSDALKRLCLVALGGG